MTAADPPQPPDFAARVRSAVLWRSGSQIAAQLVMWTATIIVVRLLDPHDYGLFAMSQVVLILFNFLNGYSFASSLIQSETIDDRQIGQAFGMLLVMNGGLAGAQVLVAPYAADYFNQPLVATLLSVQALLYLATPFIALPDALLARTLDFRNQAKANIAAAIVCAFASLGSALAGLGIWTLVIGPLALVYTRAIALSLAARLWVKPVFNFRGAGAMFAYGGAIMASSFFWLVQSQADIVIGGPRIDPHQLGLYAEALFLTQIVASKFVPPLNEVAFPAYARIRHDREALSWSFLKSVRVIFVVTAPVYLGLAVTAPFAVETLFGVKWLAMAPLVSILALAMPFLTLHILFAPATNALGRPDIAMKVSAAGALLFIAAFLALVRLGTTGLAFGWLAAMPILTAFSAAMSIAVIGVGWADLIRAVTPGLSAAGAMALLVWGMAALLPALPVALTLAVLVATGGLAYPAFLRLAAPGAIGELLRLAKRQPA